MQSEVFNIDCLEYMRTLPDKAFQLAIADPPYGINAPNMKMGENNGYESTSTENPQVKNMNTPFPTKYMGCFGGI